MFFVATLVVLKSAVASPAQKAVLSIANEGGYQPVTLESLGNFDADWLNPEADPTDPPAVLKGKKIPEKIKDLNGKKVAINGFVFPTDMDSATMTDFLLLKYIPGCFFCEMPRVNDWVKVSLKDSKKVEEFAEKPVVVYGTLDVGEEKEGGYLVSLYRLKADSIKLLKA